MTCLSEVHLSSLLYTSELFTLILIQVDLQKDLMEFIQFYYSKDNKKQHLLITKIIKY